MVQTESWYQTHVGRVRKNNEDNLVVVEPADARQRRESGCLYVVADGVGGHQDGEKASTLAVTRLGTEYYARTTLSPQERLKTIIREVNDELLAQVQSDEDSPRMATTVVAAVIRGDELILANVGDSRAYLYRDGQVSQLTRDHSLVAEMVRAGAMTEEEARRSDKRNRLTRSVGSRPDLVVDVYEPIPLRKGDILLLCSDGLSGYLTPDLMAMRLAAGTPEKMGQGLLEYALKSGGADNITLVLSRIQGRTGLPAWAASRRMWFAFLLGLVVTCLVVAGLGVLFAPGVLPDWLTPSPTVSPSATPLPSHTPSATSPSAPANTAEPPTQAPQRTLPPALPTPGGPLCYYKVVSGETLSSIASNFRVPIENIRRLGGLPFENINSISIGEVVEVAGTTEILCDGRYGTWAVPTPPAP